MIQRITILLIAVVINEKWVLTIQVVIKDVPTQKNMISPHVEQQWRSVCQ